MKKLNRILIVPNPKKDGTVEAAGKLFDFLLSVNLVPVMGEFGASVTADDNLDLIIVLGGDGSIINVAGCNVELEIPVLGINYGNVGYLAQLQSDDYNGLLSILQNELQVQYRMLLDVSIIRNGEIIASKIAVNDAVLSNGPVVRLMSYDVFDNGKLSESLRSDSLIVATPTGSSAYSMSAGGPLIDPELSVFSVTPVCPQKLHVRTCIYDGDRELSIKNISANSNDALLSLDGRLFLTLEPGDEILIKKSKYKLPLVIADNRSFPEILYSKLTDNS